MVCTGDTWLRRLQWRDGCRSDRWVVLGAVAGMVAVLKRQAAALATAEEAGMSLPSARQVGLPVLQDAAVYIRYTQATMGNPGQPSLHCRGFDVVSRAAAHRRRAEATMTTVGGGY